MTGCNLILNEVRYSSSAITDRYINIGLRERHQPARKIGRIVIGVWPDLDLSSYRA